MQTKVQIDKIILL